MDKAFRHTYELMAATIHVGNPESGHLKCVSKNKDDSWTLFDDDKAEVINGNEAFRLIENSADSVMFRRIKKDKADIDKA